MTADAGTAILTRAATLLAAAEKDPSAPYRFPVLATVAADGAPDARTVILRHFDRATWTVTVYSDRRAAKLAELTFRPDAMLAFYDPVAQMQVRLKGRTAIATDGGAVDAAWSALPATSRRAYLAQAAPGSSLPEPGDGLPPAAEAIDLAATEAGRRHFAVIRLVGPTVDILVLDRSGNRRYRFDPATGAGGWLIP